MIEPGATRIEAETLDAGVVREDFDGTLSRIEAGGDRIVLSRGGKAVAALVPVEDVAFLEELEREQDRRDVEEVEKRLADPNEVSVPYEEARKRLGLT